MAHILIALDGSAPCLHALEWAAQRAYRTGAELTLLTVIDPGLIRESGASEEFARTAAMHLLDEACGIVEAKCPALEPHRNTVVGRVVDTLVNASNRYDMVVLGTHGSASLSRSIGGATGLRVSVSTSVPTVVVPADWESAGAEEGIVVGLGPDDVSTDALTFGVREALACDQPLDLVAVWGLPPLLSRPAEAMGGGLAPVGEQWQVKLNERARQLAEAHPGLIVAGHAVESSSPAQGLIEYGKRSGLLVLGTHSRAALGRALFGSVTHGVLLAPSIPTVVVP